MCMGVLYSRVLELMATSIIIIKNYFHPFFYDPPTVLLPIMCSAFDMTAYISALKEKPKKNFPKNVYLCTY